MALFLGELFGTIGLDASDWDKKVKGAEGSLKKFGENAPKVALAAAAAVGAAITKGIWDSMDVEAGNDKLKASLGLTEVQAAKAGRAAGSLFANNYGESIQDVNSAVEAVMSSIKGMRDASDSDVESMTVKMMNLSTVMGIDVARAAQVAGQMITSGIATDGAHAADLLSASMQKVPQNVREDIIDAIDEYGPFMKNIGIMGEEAMGILVQASEKGMYGIDKTGDAIKEFGIRATDMSAASKAGYDAMGMSQEEMSAKLIAGGESAKTAFGDIIHGLQQIEDPVAQSQAALALFGTPLEDLSVTEIPNFLGALDPMGDKFDSVAGAADQMGKDLTSNSKTGFAGFMRQAQVAMIDFVQAEIMPSVSTFANFLNTTAGPALIQFAGWITSDALPALRGFGDWFNENLPVIQNWATGIGIILIPLFLRIAVSAVTSAAAQVVAWASAAGGAIKTAAVYVASGYIMVGRWIAMGVAAVASGAVTVAIWSLYATEAIKGAAVFVVQTARVVGGWVLMGAQSLIQAGRMAAAWFIALGPIGWIAAAVIGIAALLIANWESVSKFTAEAWANVSKVLGDWASDTAGMFVDFFTNTVGMVSDFMTNMRAPFEAGFAIVQTIFSTAWEIIQTYVATALAILIAVFTGQFDKIPAYLASAWEKISGFFMAGVAAIDSILGGGITAAVNFVMGIWNGLVAWVAGIPQRFLDGLAALGQLAATVGAYIVAMKDAAVQIFMDAVAFVGTIPQLFMNGLAALGQLAGTVGAWILSVKDAAVGKFNELVAWVRGVPGMVLSGLAAIGSLAGTVGSWIAGVRDSAVAKFNDLVNWVRGVPGMILSALGNMGSLLLNAGGQIIDGFLSGLTKGFEEVKNFVGGIGQWIAEHKGPKAYDLALLVPAGGWIMDGLETGLMKSIPSLKKTLGSVSATIQSGVTGGTVGLTGSGAGFAGSSTDNSRAITYAPVFQAGPDFREQERIARTRFMDTLNVYV